MSNINIITWNKYKKNHPFRCATIFSKSGKIDIVSHMKKYDYEYKWSIDISCETRKPKEVVESVINTYISNVKDSKIEEVVYYIYNNRTADKFIDIFVKKNADTAHYNSVDDIEE